MAPQKKKVITFNAFKSNPTIFDDDDEEENDEEFSLLVKNIRRMYNMAKFNNRRRWQKKEDKKVIYFNCRKPGYMVADCPETKSKHSTSKQPYKNKALKATWDSESETDEEVDTAYVYFMANDNTPKVTFEPSLDDSELTMDELGEVFEELSNNYVLTL